MKTETHTLKESFLFRSISHDNKYDYSVVHRHDYFEILLFDNGYGGLQVIDFQKFAIRTNDLYIVAPGQIHLLKRLENESGSIIQFTKDYLVQSISPLQLNWLFSLRNNPKNNLSTDQFSKLNLLFSQLKTLYHSETSHKHEKIRCFFAYIFFEIQSILVDNPGPDLHSNIAYQFIDLADIHFKEIRSVGEYAKIMNISVNKLIIHVKNHFNKTPIQIIHNLLLTEIKRLIVIENLSHKEIAFLLNFDSQSSYSRFVKRLEGINPSILSKKLRRIHK